MNGNAVTRITFVPGTQYSSSNSGSFLARRFNPSNEERVYKRIRDKVTQIKKSGVALPAILVLCDNDCTVLNPSMTPNWEKGILDSIENFIAGRPEWREGEFLLKKGFKQQTQSINAVLLLSVKQGMVFSRLTSLQIEGKWLLNRSQARHQLSTQTLEEFGRMFEHAPQLRRTPVNSRKPPRRPAHYGGVSMKGNSIQLSALTIQDLLAGRIKHDEFVRDHGMLATALINMVNDGRCISAVRFIPTSDTDDDIVELTFDGSDPRNLRRLVEDRG